MESSGPPRRVSPLLLVADAVSSPLIIVGNAGVGGAFVEAANDLAVQLLRPDSNGHLERDDSKGLWSSLLRMPLAELLQVVGGQLEAGCIADCTTCLPSGATVAVKCDCRRCDLPDHPNLLFVNLMPGISEPDAFEDEDERESLEVEEEEAVALNQVKIQSLKILLVEDDAFSASVISELCRSCDFRVTARLTPPPGPTPGPPLALTPQPPPASPASLTRLCAATVGGRRRGQPAAAARERRHAAERAVQPGALRRDDARHERHAGPRADTPRVRTPPLPAPPTPLPAPHTYLPTHHHPFTTIHPPISPPCRLLPSGG